MAIPSYRRGEKRRTARVTISVPLRVDGENMAGDSFVVRTKTHTVSQFGCLLQLDEVVNHDQTIVLMNEFTRQSVQCRVVSTRKLRDGKKYIGVEFITPMANFWRISFCKPGARSMKRF